MSILNLEPNIDALCEELTKVADKFKLAIEEAYKEGYREGYGRAHYKKSLRIGADWMESLSKAELDAAMETGE